MVSGSITMADGDLTREELKDIVRDVNLAVDGWENNWNKDKQKFYLNQMTQNYRTRK